MFLGLSSYALMYFVAVLLACTGAARWGGRTEYAGAVAMAAAAVATPIVAIGDPAAGAEYGVMVVDAVLLLVLLILALRTDRYWPMWAAAFHLTSMTIHLAKVVDAEVAWRPYLHANAFWAYPMLLALAIGAWREGPRGRRLRAPHAPF